MRAMRQYACIFTLLKVGVKRLRSSIPNAAQYAVTDAYASQPTDYSLAY